MESHYLHSWEAYTSTKGERYERLKKQLETVTISEITSQYNSITQSKSWNVPLSELYLNEITGRILSEATFMVSIVYRSALQWESNPFVSIQLGFDDSYSVLDSEGEVVLENDPGIVFHVVTNDQFEDEIQRTILSQLLQSQPSLNAHVTKVDHDWTIISLDDILVPSMTVVEHSLSVPITIYHSPDFHLLYMLIHNILNGTHEEIRTHPIEPILTPDDYASLNTHYEIVPLPSADDLVRKTGTNYPALWNKIHLTALKCEGPDGLKRFSEWIWNVCKNLPCGECKFHMLQYILTHQPDDLITTSSDSEINIAFYWTWKFHNDVNLRLEKPLYPYESALEYYSKLL